MKNIVLVEDNEDIGSILNLRLGKKNYSATWLRDGFGVLGFLGKKAVEPDAFILDLMLPGRSGLELINSIKSTYPAAKIFVFSAHKEYSRQIPPGYIDGFIEKTDGIDVLLASMEQSLKK
jgi:DNA-binding response OmpR family regulator